MKKTLLLLLLLTTTICGHSQVVDAFKGVWPVTDPAAMKSLNGEWQLRVVNRIDDHGATVPVADETWGRIPVPEAWRGQFKGYEFDCFDDWATMGIFRDVTLMATWSRQVAVLRTRSSGRPRHLIYIRCACT